MSSCNAVDALMTLYIDGEASDMERRAVDAHLSSCATCRARAAGHAAVRRLVRTRAAEARAMGVPPPWRPGALGGVPAPSAWRLPLRTGWAMMAAAVLLVVSVVWLARQSTVSATGMIVDSTCAERYRHGGRMAADEHDCTLQCVERGAEFVFVSNAIVHQIHNQDFPDLPRLAGAQVQLVGTVTDDASAVSRLTAARP